MVQQSLQSTFLQLIDESLTQSPERGDYWMMRFDALKSLGAQEEFGRSVARALANPKISRQLNWIELRSMWDEMAPGEPFPDGTERVIASPAPGELLPDLPAPRPRRTGPRTHTGPLRRFKDVAMRVASEELASLARDYAAISVKPSFLEDFARKSGPLLVRPTPLEFSERFSRLAGAGKRVYLKREDRRGVPVECENAAAQCYIGSLLGKKRVITGNDVDAHALEVATVAPFFDLKCTVVVRPEDFDNKPQFISDLVGLGAKVEPLPEKGMIGTDPREGAILLWKRASEDSHLVLSLGMAPQPHTAMANAFQALVGREAEAQYIEMAHMLKRPRTVVSAVGSEADSLGFVLPFLNRREIRVAYAEPEPGGPGSWKSSERLRPYNGQIREHSWLYGVGRIQYVPVPDDSSLDCQTQLARDGIQVGVEDSRALALTLLLAQGDPTPRDFLVLVG